MDDHSRLQDGELVMRVSELLLENGQWNEELIRHTFIPVDAAAILCTPARAQLDDVWAWEPEKHGVYSVRSAYRLLDTVRIRNTATQDAGGLGDTCWQKLWKLKVPLKIKVFWWRVIHEFLPARQVLHWKHIETCVNQMFSCKSFLGADQSNFRH